MVPLKYDKMHHVSTAMLWRKLALVMESLKVPEQETLAPFSELH